MNKPLYHLFHHLVMKYQRFLGRILLRIFEQHQSIYIRVIFIPIYFLAFFLRIGTN
jgi:hypothetical protein